MPDKNAVRIGMDVVGLDGISVGQVKDLRQRDFLLDRENEQDILIPYDAVQTAIADQLTLNILADRVDKQGWPRPDPFETPDLPAS